MLSIACNRLPIAFKVQQIPKHDLHFGNLNNVFANQLKPDVSISSHLQDIFDVMVLHYPENALEKFEEVSYLIKHGMELNDFLKIEELRNFVDLSAL